MAVTLAKRDPVAPARRGRRRVKLMEKFVIEGGVPLSGTMVPAGNKNGALPILASSILTEDEVVVRNVPRIRDVEAMLEILKSIGVAVSWRGANEVVLCAADAHQVEVDAFPGLRSTDVFFFVNDAAATENALMAAALTPGTTVIGNAACEPH